MRARRLTRYRHPDLVAANPTPVSMTRPLGRSPQAKRWSIPSTALPSSSLVRPHEAAPPSCATWIMSSKWPPHPHRQSALPNSALWSAAWRCWSSSSATPGPRMTAGSGWRPASGAPGTARARSGAISRTASSKPGRSATAPMCAKGNRAAVSGGAHAAFNEEGRDPVGLDPR
jgi:hypothetical protein